MTISDGNAPEMDARPAGGATETSPWHAGERSLQLRYGAAERMEKVGRRVIRDFMPDQHREFFAQLPFVVAGTVDEGGRPWATILEGPPGFAHSPDPRRLVLECRPTPSDPAGPGLRDGAAIGLLGIELATRRRNRLNGRIRGLEPDRLTVAVDQSFGNCPQYIQRREAANDDRRMHSANAASDHLASLDEAATALIRAADTFFVATYADPEGDATRRGIDVSHRGGRPGFVRVDGDRLTIPDFPGNLHFNTLGNLVANPRAGLLFVDFDSGDVLQLSGRTELVFEGPEVAGFEAAERLWRLEIESIVRRKRALGLRLRLTERSKESLATGSWALGDPGRSALGRQAPGA